MVGAKAADENAVAPSRGAIEPLVQYVQKFGCLFERAVIIQLVGLALAE